MSGDERLFSMLQLLSTQQSQLMRRMDTLEEKLTELNNKQEHEHEQAARHQSLLLPEAVVAAEEDDCVSWLRDLLHICCHC